MITNNYTKLLAAFRSTKYGTLIIYCVFSLSVFLQCVLFSWLAFHNIAISSLWKNPFYFVSFYLPKLSIALLLGSFVFLFRRKYWTIYASVFYLYLDIGGGNLLPFHKGVHHG